MGGNASLDECQMTCTILLDCGWTLSCSERTLSDARSSCRSLCQGSEASQILDLKGSTCVTTENILPSLLGIECSTDLCAQQECSPGTSCNPQTGNCEDPCAGILCENGSICRQGICESTCPDTCPQGEACEDELGECRPLCELVSCAMTEYCDPSDGSCISNCEGIECSDGLSCDPRSGDCIDLCAELACDEGLICDADLGSCIDPCMNVNCADGWLCEQGSCVIDYPCNDVECPMFTVCNPETLSCDPYLCENDRFEVGFTNNLFINATPLNAETQRLDNLHICFTDTDWYKIIIPANESARVSLYSSPSSGALMIRWYSESDPLFPIYEADTRSSPEVINIPARTEAQTAYFRISSANGILAQNRYILTVELGGLEGIECNGSGDQSQGCNVEETCVDGVCIESTDPVDPIDPIEPTCTQDQYEPNESFDNATEITNGQVIEGIICIDDLDLYRLTIDEISDLTVTVNFVHMLGDIDAYIMNSLEVLERSYTLSDQENITLLDAPPGTYYIGIYGYLDDVENSYSLTVSHTPTTP